MISKGTGLNIELRIFPSLKLRFFFLIVSLGLFGGIKFIFDRVIKLMDIELDKLRQLWIYKQIRILIFLGDLSR